MSLALFEKGGPEDSVLRGYTREFILNQTGIDVGYNGNAYKARLKGIDRDQYKLAYVRANYDAAYLQDVLDKYAGGMPKSDVLDAVGLYGEKVKLGWLFAGLGLDKEFREADKQFRKNNMHNGTVGKFGVDNVFKLKEFQDAAAETRQEKYGAGYTLANGSVLRKKARETFREHMQDEGFAKSLNERRKAAIHERYGVDHPAQSEEIRQTMRNTCLERYGCEHWAQTEEGRKRLSECAKETSVERAEKAHQTCMEKYGVPYWSQTAEGRQAQSERGRERYAESSVKARVTCLERYGTEYYSQTPEARERVRSMVLAQSEEFLKKSRQTCMERYGVPYWTQTDEGRKAQSERMSDPKYQQNIKEAKKRNGTFKVSADENILQDMLIEKFGADDVEVQYVDKRYPYACDFYIKSRDLFIELNESWTHGYGWYRGQDLPKHKDTPYWRNAVHTHTVRDVRKRSDAAKNRLNYVVFWCKDLMDAKLWFAMGCPDGQDWLQEYSWIPERHISCNVDMPEPGSGYKVYIRAAKAVNGGLFYARELALWEKNPVIWGKGPLHGFLYANRYQYIGKLPHELMDLEILRGFGISGIMKSYSVYDTTSFEKVIKDYDVRSVYDPCAGWGERMAACGCLGVEYTGVDIREDVVDGHGRLVKEWNLTKQRTWAGDSSQEDMTQGPHDAVITCPPYHNVEIYSDKGAENLDYEGFLKWWDDVVTHSVSPTVKIFAYQIKSQYAEDMDRAVMSHGFALDSVLICNANMKNHYARKTGTGNAKETMRVFVRA